MRITEQSRYAVMVLATLAERYPEAMTVADISAATGITEFNLFKLMKVIVRHGLVSSSRGRGGGIRLARPPERISIGGVIRAIEPRFLACAPAGRLAGAEAPRSWLATRTDEAIGLGLKAFLRELDSISIEAFTARATPRDRMTPRGRTA